eukprot:6213025-Pleurochrysis_carterae.AAC.5
MSSAYLPSLASPRACVRASAPSATARSAPRSPAQHRSQHTTPIASHRAHFATSPSSLVTFQACHLGLISRTSLALTATGLYKRRHIRPYTAHKKRAATARLLKVSNKHLQDARQILPTAAAATHMSQL